MTANPPLEVKPKTWLFTKDNARQMSAKGKEALARRRERLRQAIETVETPVTTAGDNDYKQRRLSRVRLQLDRVDRMLLEEDDPSKLDRLASAVARLSEVERQLSNRSLPPSQKPVSQAKARRESEPTGEPMPAQPAPIIKHDPNEPNG